MPPSLTTLTPLLLLPPILLLLLLVLFFFSPFPSHSFPPPSSSTPHSLFLSLSSNSTISSHLHTLTLTPHLAGTPSSLPISRYVLSHLPSSFSTPLSPLLSFPLHSSLSVVVRNSTLISLFISEPRNGSGDGDPVVQPYHAFSPSGSVLAPAVYVNYGREEDYERVSELGVGVKGCVVVVRSGVGYRGNVIRRAEGKGAAAVVMFRDYGDGDDPGFVGKGGVERGTALVGGPGDVLTPGWAAESGAERLELGDEEVRRRFPGIPSMPVNAEAAVEILRRIGGPAIPEEWRGKFWREDNDGGVGGGEVLVNFTYLEEKRIATIRNVFGVIKGREEPDRYVVLGNHRDAWTYGAVDPNSGTATLLEIARRFGVLLRSGWHPRRTILFCSWDAEEFGMIGSTEWVEENLGILASKVVAYVNVDCAVQGPGLFASATPQLDKLLLDVMKKVKDPDSVGMTVFQTWEAANKGANIERLARADSDFTAFLHFAGIPSIDLYFGKDFPVYHTVFDSFDWMKKYGDPYFHRHGTVADIWGLVALRLADDGILPFDYMCYATQLLEHVNALHVAFDGVLSLKAMNASLSEFILSARMAEAEAQKLLNENSLDGPMELRRRAFNDKLMHVERSFLEEKGLKGRPWYKHLIYSPPEDYNSKLAFFPGIIDAVQQAEVGHGSNRSIQHEVWRVARAIQRAARALRGELP